MVLPGVRFWFSEKCHGRVEEMDIGVKGAANDEKLSGILALVRQATETLLEALESCELGLSFKAFTIRKFEGEHAEEQMKSLTDTIGAGIIVAIQDLNRKIVEVWDLDVACQEKETEVELWIYAKPHQKDDGSGVDGCDRESGEITGGEGVVDELVAQ
jgi:hypothetical protein